MYQIDNPVISIKNLTKRFGEHTVLDNLSFDIAEGKITTILGFSGAGKSTLMKHILGLLTPTEGHITVLGKELVDMKATKNVNFVKISGCFFSMRPL